MSRAEGRPKTVVVVSSHVVRGSVGNRAAVFALETLGHPVWSLPTVILPWHPGHGRATRHAVSGEVFHAIIDDLIGAPWLGEVDAVLSGYLADRGQADDVARLVAAVRSSKPDAPYLCDPVMGDLKGLYVSEDLADAIRDVLIPLASIATPNRYELAHMAGAQLDDNASIMEAALSLGPERVLVTSAVPKMTGGIGNLLLTPQHAYLSDHRAVSDPPNGLGDLLSAVFLSRLSQGLGDEKALQMATASVFEMVARTMRRGADELTLASDAESISSPMAMVHMHRLTHPGAKRRI